MSVQIVPVILSGGAGTRLWPLSTPETPKQFHPLASDNTLLQDTVDRTAGDHGARILPPIVICNQCHTELVTAQLADEGRAPAIVVLEPLGRDTAAPALIASLAAQMLEPQALVLLMPSDHLMSEPGAFMQAVIGAATVAEHRIVTFGVRPTQPETGYGYIEAGDALDDLNYTVRRFVEKPDLATARDFLSSGGYFWNAGIFLFSPALMIRELERLAPDVARHGRAAFERGVRTKGVIALDADAFAACPPISLDYAVMEHTDKAAVTPIEAGWTDIGSWSSLWEQGPRDANNNLVRGAAELIDTQDCLVWSQGRTLGAIGLRDLIIVQTEDAVVVLPRSRAQDVKRLVEQIRRRSDPSAGP